MAAWLRKWGPRGFSTASPSADSGDRPDICLRAVNESSLRSHLFPLRSPIPNTPSTWHYGKTLHFHHRYLFFGARSLFSPGFLIKVQIVPWDICVSTFEFKTSPNFLRRGKRESTEGPGWEDTHIGGGGWRLISQTSLFCLNEVGRLLAGARFFTHSLVPDTRVLRGRKFSFQGSRGIQGLCNSYDPLCVAHLNSQNRFSHDPPGSLLLFPVTREGSQVSKFPWASQRRPVHG